MAGSSFQHFSNSYTLKDEFYHHVTSDATVIKSYICPIFGKQAVVILIM